MWFSQHIAWKKIITACFFHFHYILSGISSKKIVWLLALIPCILFKKKNFFYILPSACLQNFEALASYSDIIYPLCPYFVFYCLHEFWSFLAILFQLELKLRLLLGKKNISKYMFSFGYESRFYISFCAIRRDEAASK